MYAAHMHIYNMFFRKNLFEIMYDFVNQIFAKCGSSIATTTALDEYYQIHT